MKLKNMKVLVLQTAMLAAAFAAATSASAAFSANGNLGDWNIWSPDPAPNGSYGGSASVTTIDGAGGPNGGGYTILQDMYPLGQDGGEYTFFGNGSSTPPPALSSQSFSQSIAIYLEPTVEFGSLTIDETPSSTVKDPGTGTYELWAAENGFTLSGNASSLTITTEFGNQALGTINGLSAAGWYDFNMAFTTTGETMSVYDLTTSSFLGSFSVTQDYSDLAGSGYLWMTEWNGSFTDPGALEVADLSAVPEPTTLLAGAMMLLPFGASTLRFLRKNRTA